MAFVPDVDTDVAQMFGELREAVGRLIATTDRIETQTKATNGHVAEAFIEIDQLKQINDLRAGADAERRKIGARLMAAVTLVGVFAGGILAAVVQHYL